MDCVLSSFDEALGHYQKVFRSSSAAGEYVPDKTAHASIPNRSDVDLSALVAGCPCCECAGRDLCRETGWECRAFKQWTVRGAGKEGRKAKC